MNKKVFLPSVVLFLFFGCFDYIDDLDAVYPRDNPKDVKSQNYKSVTSTTIAPTTTVLSVTTISTTTLVSTTSSTLSISTTIASTTSTTVFTTSTTTTTLKLWVKSYKNAAYNEKLSDMKNTFDGGYILAGASGDGTYMGNSKCLIIKLDAIGNIKWKKTYFVPDYYNTYGKSIIQKSDGSYLVSAASYDGNTNANIYILLFEINSAGDVLWKRTFKFSGTDYFNDSLKHGKMVQAENNNFLLYGDYVGGSFVIKIDQNGVVLMKKIFKTTGEYNYIDSVTPTKDNGFAIAGYKLKSVYLGGGIPPTKNYKFWMAKVSESGVISWENEFSTGSVGVNAVKIDQTNNLNYIFTGNIYSGYNDIIVMKLSNSGGVIWQKKIGDDMYNIPYDAYVDSNDECVIVGENHYEIGSNNKNALVLGLDKEGNVKYQRCYFYIWYDMFNSIVKLQDGSFIIGGENALEYGGIRDLWISHIDYQCSISQASFIYSPALTALNYSLTSVAAATEISDGELIIDNNPALTTGDINIAEENIY